MIIRIQMMTKKFLKILRCVDVVETGRATQKTRLHVYKRILMNGPLEFIIAKLLVWNSVFQQVVCRSLLFG